MGRAVGPELTAGDARVFVDGKELDGASSVRIEARPRELSAFDLDVLVAVFRDQQDHRRAWPESLERAGPEKVQEAMWRLRAARLMGWEDGRPRGLTRLGALVAHERDQERTRDRQVRNYLAEEQLRLARLRGSVELGHDIHAEIGDRARELERAQAELNRLLARDSSRPIRRLA